MKVPPLLLVLLLTTAVACERDQEVAPFDPGYDYFPTQPGLWVEYTVDSAWQNDVIGAIGTHSYRLRERITNDFTDPEGRTAQRLIREQWDTTWNNWQPKDVWWQVRTPTNAERAEENERRIKLIFPTREGQQWNTNALNTRRPYQLVYAEVDVPWSVNGLSFDSTLLVKTTYQDNPIISNTYYERYAKHIGLVHRRVDSTNTQYGSGTPEVRGTWYEQVIVDHGE